MLDGVEKANFIWVPGHSRVHGNEKADKLILGEKMNEKKRLPPG